jgi:hypothetical protein
MKINKSNQIMNSEEKDHEKKSHILFGSNILINNNKIKKY